MSSDIYYTSYKIYVVLYRHGVVKFESVMKLREKLDHLGQMKGIPQDEKGRMAKLLELIRREASNKQTCYYL